MPHLPFLAIAALVVAVPTWLLAGQSSRVNTEFEFTGRLRTTLFRPVSAGSDRGRRSGGRPEWDFRHTRCRRTGDCRVQVTPGEILRVRVGGWGGEAVGSTPGAGGWNGGGAGGEALDRDGKAGSGGGGATDVRRGGDGLAHRIIVGCRRIGWRRRRDRRPDRDRRRQRGRADGHEGFAVLGSANPATGGEGGTQTAGGDPGRNASDLSVTATAGSLGAGGDGAAGGASGGGGGGGGLYGGGGGGSSRSFSGGHGGGGSGFGPAGTVFRAGVGAGFGRAKISYDRDQSACGRAWSGACSSKRSRAPHPASSRVPRSHVLGECLFAERGTKQGDVVARGRASRARTASMPTASRRTLAHAYRRTARPDRPSAAASPA